MDWSDCDNFDIGMDFEHGDMMKWFVALFVLAIVNTATAGHSSKGHHWCGDNIDNPPKHGVLKKNFRGPIVWEQGYPSGEIWKPRCGRDEYESKWGPKTVETYRTKDGEIVRGIWFMACCAHDNGKKYPHWSWWREQ